MITFFRRLRSVRLIRLEQRSLSVGKNFGLAKTLYLDIIPLTDGKSILVKVIAWCCQAKSHSLKYYWLSYHQRDPLAFILEWCLLEYQDIIPKLSLKFTHLKLQPHRPGDSELRTAVMYRFQDRDFSAKSTQTHFALPFQVNYTSRSVKTVPYSHEHFAR